LPQFVHIVRSVVFPSARYALPLIGTIAPLADDEKYRDTLTIRAMPRGARSDCTPTWMDVAPNVLMVKPTAHPIHEQKSEHNRFIRL
jgi:hypothetical protein